MNLHQDTQATPKKKNASFFALIVFGVMVAGAGLLAVVAKPPFVESLKSTIDSRVSGEDPRALELQEEFISKLVSLSPWRVQWRGLRGNESGEHRLSFSRTNNAGLAGRIFDAHSGVEDGHITDVRIMDECVSFIFSVTGTTYTYCLEEDGGNQLLDGAISRFGNYTATAIAQPTQ